MPNQESESSTETVKIDSTASITPAVTNSDKKDFVKLSDVMGNIKPGMPNQESESSTETVKVDNGPINTNIPPSSKDIIVAQNGNNEAAAPVPASEEKHDVDQDVVAKSA